MITQSDGEMQKRGHQLSLGKPGSVSETAPGARCEDLSMILLSMVNAGRGHCWQGRCGSRRGKMHVCLERMRGSVAMSRGVRPHGGLWLLLTRVLGLLNQQELIRGRTGSSGES